MYLFLNITVILYGLMDGKFPVFLILILLSLFDVFQYLSETSFSYLIDFFPLNFRNAILTILVLSFIFTWLYVSFLSMSFSCLLCNTFQKFCIHCMDVICVCVYRVLAFGVNVSLKHTLYIMLLYGFGISLLHNIPFII